MSESGPQGVLPQDGALMDAAIAAARQGRPSPNPHVGAVVATADGEIIATGHHARVGLAHAEVDAIRNAERTEGMTLYVTMEPCNHHGRTPPCTEAILNAGFARVVIGAIDPFPHVRGSTQRLRDAGLEVVVGVRGQECRALIADFAKHISTKRPFVTLKAALTLDGKMAAESGDSKWITGEASRTEAHRLRDQSDAILVGIGTVLADDPSLTVRHIEGVDPQRVVLDATLRTPVAAKVLGAWVFHGPGAPEERKAPLIAAGATLIEVPAVEDGLCLESVLDELGRRDIVRLLVEGGAAVHDAFLRRNLGDRAVMFVAPKLLGPGRSIAAAVPLREKMAEAWTLENVQHKTLGNDVMIAGDLPPRRD